MNLTAPLLQVGNKTFNNFMGDMFKTLRDVLFSSAGEIVKVA